MTDSQAKATSWYDDFVKTGLKGKYISTIKPHLYPVLDVMYRENIERDRILKIALKLPALMVYLLEVKTIVFSDLRFTPTQAELFLSKTSLSDLKRLGLSYGAVINKNYSVKIGLRIPMLIENNVLKLEELSPVVIRNYVIKPNETYWNLRQKPELYTQEGLQKLLNEVANYSIGQAIFEANPEKGVLKKVLEQTLGREDLESSAYITNLKGPTLHNFLDLITAAHYNKFKLTLPKYTLFMGDYERYSPTKTHIEKTLAGVKYLLEQNLLNIVESIPAVLHISTGFAPATALFASSDILESSIGRSKLSLVQDMLKQLAAVKQRRQGNFLVTDLINYFLTTDLKSLDLIAQAGFSFPKECESLLIKDHHHLLVHLLALSHESRKGFTSKPKS